jgi:transposase-like protein
MRDQAVENVTANAASEKAMLRFRMLRPVLEDDVSIVALANSSGISVPTLRRWLRLYRKQGVREQRNGKST